MIKNILVKGKTIDTQNLVYTIIDDKGCIMDTNIKRENNICVKNRLLGKETRKFEDIDYKDEEFDSKEFNKAVIEYLKANGYIGEFSIFTVNTFLFCDKDSLKVTTG